MNMNTDVPLVIRKSVNKEKRKEFFKKLLCGLAIILVIFAILIFTNIINLSSDKLEPKQQVYTGINSIHKRE